MPTAAALDVRELTFGDAIKEAIAEEMRRDPKVVLMGEDVAEAGTTFKVLTGLVDEFGKDRIIDTPISEAGFTGLGVGAAMTGHAADRRHHVRRLPDDHHGPGGQPGRQDPLHVGRQAGRCRWSSARRWARRAARPRSTRSRCTRGRATFPGLKVVVPSTPYDAKGLFKAAVRDDNPVVIFEHKISYRKVKGPVPGRGLHHSARRGRREARRAATSRSSRSAAWCRWRSAPPRCSRKSASAPRWWTRAPPGRSTRRRWSSR